MLAWSSIMPFTSQDHVAKISSIQRRNGELTGTLQACLRPRRLPRPARASRSARTPDHPRTHRPAEQHLASRFSFVQPIPSRRKTPMLRLPYQPLASGWECRLSSFRLPKPNGCELCRMPREGSVSLRDLGKRPGQRPTEGGTVSCRHYFRGRCDCFANLSKASML